MKAIHRFAFAWANAGKLDSMSKEMRRLNDLNADLDKQVRELLAAHPMTDAQLEEIRMVRHDNEIMKKQHDIVTIYLRTRWPRDFQSGRHGMRTFSEIVISYLSRLEESDAQKAS